LKLISTVNVDNVSKCLACMEAKYVKKLFKSITGRQTALLKLVHSDLVDFKNTASKEGKTYYITFVDDCSRYTKVYLLWSKNEAEENVFEIQSRIRKSIRLKDYKA